MKRKYTQSKIKWNVRKKRATGMTYTKPKAKYVRPNYKKVSRSTYKTAYSGVRKTYGGLGGYVGTKHVKGKGYYKARVSPKLARAISAVSKKAAMKQLPIADIKGIALGELTLPPNNVQQSSNTSTAVVSLLSTNSAATSNDVGFKDTFDILSYTELLSLLNQSFNVTATGNVATSKFDVMYAKKEYKIFNNGTVHYSFSAVEWVANDDLPVGTNVVTEANNFLSNMTTQTGTNATNTQPRLSVIGVMPTLAKPFRERYKTKITTVALAPGQTYTHTIKCSQMTINLADWKQQTTGFFDYKKGVTKGVFFLYNYAPVGTNVLTTGTTQWASVPTTGDSLNIQVTAHYKFTAPDGGEDALAFDQTVRGINFAQAAPLGPIAITAAQSTFDRTALKLAAGS